MIQTAAAGVGAQPLSSILSGEADSIIPSQQTTQAECCFIWVSQDLKKCDGWPSLQAPCGGTIGGG